MKSTNKVSTTVLFALLVMFGAMACTYKTEESQRVLGYAEKIGNGEVSSYVEFTKEGKPAKIGIVFSADALEGLPASLSDGHNCSDRNDDGKIDRNGECNPWHEWVIPLPREVSRNTDIPFKWVLLNWNPGGHIPPGVYDRPHFDVHYVMEPIADIFSIEAGTCGPEFVSCEQFETGRKSVPDNYMHTDFQNVDAVAPSMGNHLVDLTAREFNGKPFTHTWIFGTYNGRIIFYEQMATREFILSKTNEELAIKSPPAVGKSGYYPTVYSVKYDDDTDEYAVSIEGFAYREAGNAKWTKK